jgi:xylulose-5-phosphate/fructose-6-phosphate phosphoketolase
LRSVGFSADSPVTDRYLNDLGRLSAYELAALDASWRACNYLTIGQIYLKDNALLRRALSVDDIKPRLMGHWGTSPGQSFIYAHVRRLIAHPRQSVICPDHGGPASSLPPGSGAFTPRSIPTYPGM